MLDKSPDDLADLYTVDAVHEFPFSSPGFPPSFEGREAVRAGYRAAWGGSAVQVKEVRSVAAYETADPEVIIAEHVVVGTLPTKATTFTVPGLLILHVRNGLITRVRDYMDGLGVASARK
ncbi:nuclear transport factor 2 family protein [Streptomyces sp. OE57]|uniref:nuclear transport factor 2 family protein n=1 Tax=Streptomyces lacaronensis TaxID=3379885 RepID=UPI0039B734BB